MAHLTSDHLGLAKLNHTKKPAPFKFVKPAIDKNGGFRLSTNKNMIVPPFTKAGGDSKKRDL